MKNTFCCVVYNKDEKSWYSCYKTYTNNDFIIFKSKVKCIKYSKKKSKSYKLILYIYDKKNKITDKIDYNIK